MGIEAQDEIENDVAIRIKRIREAFADSLNETPLTEAPQETTPMMSWRNAFNQSSPWRNAFNQKK